MVGGWAATPHGAIRFTFPRIEKRKASAPDEARVIVIVPRHTGTADLAEPDVVTNPGAT